MTVLSHQSILEAGIFKPFFTRTKHEPTNLTYGCGPASYDVRLAEDIIITHGEIQLASTIEYFSMPHDVCAVVHDKSSHARKGVLVQNTFIDPGWRGFLTLEISYLRLTNATIVRHLELLKGTPIAQIVLHRLDQPTQQPYSGVYQDQAAGPVASKF